MPRSKVSTGSNFGFVAPIEGAKATGLIELDNATPADGDTVELIDSNGYAVTFEFDNDSSVTAGNTLVDIGSDLDDSVTNLAAAVNASGLLIEATADTTDDEVALEQTEPVADGNTTITATFDTSANVSVTQFSGGTGDKEQVKRHSPHGFDERHDVAGNQSGASTDNLRRYRPKAAQTEFYVRQAGKLRVLIDNPSLLNDLVVTLETAPNGEKFNPITAAANGEAVDGVTIARKTYRDYNIILEEGTTLRVFATGGAKGEIQLDSDDILDPIDY